MGIGAEDITVQVLLGQGNVHKRPSRIENRSRVDLTSGSAVLHRVK